MGFTALTCLLNDLPALRWGLFALELLLIYFTCQKAINPSKSICGTLLENCQDCWNDVREDISKATSRGSLGERKITKKRHNSNSLETTQMVESTAIPPTPIPHPLPPTPMLVPNTLNQLTITLPQNTNNSIDHSITPAPQELEEAQETEPIR